MKNQLKDKAFACSVIPEDNYLGVEALGIPLDDHIAFVLDAMLPDAGEIGLS